MKAFQFPSNRIMRTRCGAGGAGGRRAGESWQDFCAYSVPTLACSALLGSARPIERWDLEQQKGLPHNLKNVYATLPLLPLIVVVVVVVAAILVAAKVGAAAAVWLPAHELAIIKNAITANFI